MTSLRAQHQKTLKTNNCRLVLRLLRDNRHKLISRADIARVTEMSPTSITRLVQQLLELNLVKQEEAFSTGVGRNGIQVCINRDAFYSAGISIDCDYVRVCIVNCVDEVLAEASEHLEERYYRPEEILEKAKKILEEIRVQAGIQEEQIEAYGIACVGNMDNKSGYVHFAAQMGWYDLSFKKLAENVFGKITCIDNDVKMALVGATYQFPEMRSSDSAYISIGAGVGAAVMYDGRLVRGISNAVGEVGHMSFALDGRKCVCGRTGCSYTYVSSVALLNLCEEHGHPMESLDELAEAIDASEEWTKAVIDEYSGYLAIFLSSMIYIYNPQYLLVGGTVIATHPVFFDEAKARLRDMMHDNLMEDVIIKKREMVINAALGAACTASERHVLSLIENYD